MKDQRRKRIENVGHLITALVVGLKGADKLTHGDKTLLGTFYLFCSILLIAVVVFHHKVHSWISHTKGPIFLVEALVIAAAGWNSMNEGKQYIQYAFWLAALINLGLAVHYLFFYRNQSRNSAPL